ncbi:MAG: PilC/PilY family type IV pilus protein, partial [Candidatus Bathyarchaeia archaeon]
GDAEIDINNKFFRTISTTIQGPGVLNPQMISFSTSSPDNTAILKPYVNPLGEDINGNSIPDELADAAAVIEFTRDPGYGGGIYKGTRNPAWKLADIYHSTPVVVEAPPNWQGAYPNAHDYATYRANKMGRPRSIYVGTNGGMLHCINDSDGTERWAFIPRSILGTLRNLRIEHQWGVDARPARAEIWSRGGTGTCFPHAAQDRDGWHTVLVFGLRQGGNSYVALDVTDPSDPRILWEFTDANLGETWSTPAFGLVKVKVGAQVKEKPVVFVGGGYSTTSNVGNRLYIIDIETGQTLTDGSNTAEFQIGDADNKVPGAIRECDYDKDGFIEKIYFGDIQGRVWKLDLSDNRMNQWNPCVLLDPDTYNWSTVSPEPSPHPTRRPIFTKPSYAVGDSGNYFVFVGTGDERNPNAADSRDFFYEIEDLPGTCSSRVNWVKVLPIGEKVLSNPAWFDYIIYFTTYKPAVVCGAGVGFIYGLKMSRGAQSQGGGEAGIVFHLQGNPIPGWATEKLALGVGVPSSPLITNGIIYVVTSNNIGTTEAIHQLTINPVGGRIRAWRERF